MVRSLHECCSFLILELTETSSQDHSIAGPYECVGSRCAFTHFRIGIDGRGESKPNSYLEDPCKLADMALTRRISSADTFGIRSGTTYSGHNSLSVGSSVNICGNNK
jgi:hypothetical protein